MSQTQLKAGFQILDFPAFPADVHFQGQAPGFPFAEKILGKTFL